MPAGVRRLLISHERRQQRDNCGRTVGRSLSTIGLLATVAAGVAGSRAPRYPDDRGCQRRSDNLSGVGRRRVAADAGERQCHGGLLGGPPRCLLRRGRSGHYQGCLAPGTLLVVAQTLGSRALPLGVAPRASVSIRPGSRRGRSSMSLRSLGRAPPPGGSRRGRWSLSLRRWQPGTPATGRLRRGRWSLSLRRWQPGTPATGRLRRGRWSLSLRRWQPGRARLAVARRWRTGHDRRPDPSSLSHPPASLGL